MRPGEARKVDKYGEATESFNMKAEGMLENVLNAYKQPGSDHIHYNLLNNVDFADTMAAGTYNTYFVEPGDTWALISYKHYGRINLWWIIAGINRIDNTFLPPVPGTRLKIPTNSSLRDIIDALKFIT